jgi:FkbM family methyltransferase
MGIIRANICKFKRHLLGQNRRNDMAREENKFDPQWLAVTSGPLQGHYMLLNLDAPTFWNKEMISGCYDSFVYDVLDELVPMRGATIWDVGAHIGYHSLTFAALVGPSGHVVAFEPNPYNVDRFRQHLEKNPDLGNRITLITCALSSMDGEENFVFSPEIDNGRSTGSHLNQTLVPEDPSAYESFSQKKVSVVTADTLLREGSVPSPSIIKIDIEGAEALFLAGAEHLLTSLRPVLLIEVHHIIAMHDTLNILLRLGYHTKILNEAPNSPSRCFIVAQPGEWSSLNHVEARSEDEPCISCKLEAPISLGSTEYRLQYTAGLDKPTL